MSNLNIKRACLDLDVMRELCYKGDNYVMFACLGYTCMSEAICMYGWDNMHVCVSFKIRLTSIFI